MECSSVPWRAFQIFFQAALGAGFAVVVRTATLIAGVVLNSVSFLVNIEVSHHSVPGVHFLNFAMDSSGDEKIIFAVDWITVGAAPMKIAKRRLFGVLSSVLFQNALHGRIF